MKLFNWLSKKNSNIWHMDTELLSMLEFYKASFELSQDAKLVLEGSKIIKFNTKALELVGATNSEQLGHHSIFEFIKGKKTYVRDILSNKLDKKTCTAEIETLDGRTLNVSIAFSPLIINAKCLTFVTIRDVTESTEVREALNSFISVLESANQGIIITDTTGKILWANKAFLDMTEYELSEIVGHNPRMLKSGKTPDNVYKSLWDTLNKGHVWEGMIVNKRKSGEEYVDSKHIVPVKVQGNLKYFISFVEDISKKKPD